MKRDHWRGPFSENPLDVSQDVPSRLCVEIYQNSPPSSSLDFPVGKSARPSEAERSSSPAKPRGLVATLTPPVASSGGGAKAIAERCAEAPQKAPKSTPLGKEHEITAPPPSDDSLFRRLERYELQRIAADLLQPFRAKNGQSPRVCKCLQVPRKAEVEIWRSLQHSKFFYGGLVICGSVWDCLPCAAKISERRRVEIKNAVEAWESMGGSVHMLTLTFPHYEHQQTAPLLEKFGAARVLMRHRKTWKTTVKALALVGSINRVEVTYGANGAHIHCHELLFSKHKNLCITPGCIFPMWSSACIASGLDAPSEQHGVKISTPRQMAEYVSKVGKEAPKWTIELEMTKGHIKRGKIEGMTPFDLLRAFRDTGDCDYADRFIEYSKAFKGKRQLTWSRGLRDLLALDEEKTDEQLAIEHEDDAVIFALVDLEAWRIIRKRNLRGQLIEACGAGIDTVQKFIADIKKGNV